MKNYRDNKAFIFIRSSIIGLIDFFYPPFSKWIPQQTFRYLVSGGTSFILDIFIYFISYHFILRKENWEIGSLVVSPHIGAFIISFCIVFPLGFALNKYVVFQDSNLKGRVQLFRYALLVIACIILNYVFLKLFVEIWHFYPTPARVITAIIVAAFSYLSQRKFTFKVKTEKGWVSNEKKQQIINNEENRK